jgi:Putative restriction endonuclease
MITVPSKNLRLPTAAELPDSDDTPVDNELQNEAPNILLEILRWIWRDSQGDASRRSDWVWGVDMGVYYEPNLEQPEASKAIVPDGFLAIGVEQRRPDEGGRSSYPLWQDKVLPILVLEVVSKTYNGEYSDKVKKYQDLGILYYVIYNPFSGKASYKERQLMEVYKSIDGKYELMSSVVLAGGGGMVWLSEIGLGIGYERGMRGDWQRDWLYWYDRSGVRYPTDAERVEQEKLAKERAEAIAAQEKLAKEQAERAQQEAEAIAARERQKNETLAAYLRSLGINPDEL